MNKVRFNVERVKERGPTALILSSDPIGKIRITTMVAGVTQQNRMNVQAMTMIPQSFGGFMVYYLVADSHGQEIGRDVRKTYRPTCRYVVYVEFGMSSWIWYEDSP